MHGYVRERVHLDSDPPVNIVNLIMDVLRIDLDTKKSMILYGIVRLTSFGPYISV